MQLAPGDQAEASTDGARMTLRLTPATAAALQRALFDDAPGAAELLLDVWNGRDERRRDRSRRALRELDPRRASSSVVEALALDVARLLVAIVYGGSREDRIRIAALLARLCREAARVSREVA
jgi:hypothetical protein